SVSEIEIPLTRLPRELDGYTIVHISDVHLGRTIGRTFAKRIVQIANSLGGDLISITGDLVDGSVDQLRDVAAPFGELSARHGVWLVTGNHEYYVGVDFWIQELSRMGIRVLRNERVAIGNGTIGFDLAGVDDWEANIEGHGYDLLSALKGRDCSRPLVLLAHQPKTIVEASRLGVDLLLSGHTHGGQIWPGSWLVRLQQPYVAGLHLHGETYLYVNRGVGYWGPPMRVGSKPEIARLVLRSASKVSCNGVSKRSSLSSSLKPKKIFL
ncbi:MAG: metallophosphoesterase, partial [Desulfobacteraceae bacterium]